MLRYFVPLCFYCYCNCICSSLSGCKRTTSLMFRLILITWGSWRIILTLLRCCSCTIAFKMNRPGKISLCATLFLVV